MVATLHPRSAVTLFEYADANPRRVDRDLGVLRRVKIIGFESANGRTYSAEVLRRALPLYEGARVHIDHPPAGKAASTRTVDSWAGVLENVLVGADGLYGDLRLRRESKHFAEIIEAAEHFPRSLGLSHNAEGPIAHRNGRTIVEEILRVHSVDLVTKPATTKGLFESEIPGEPVNGVDFEAKRKAMIAQFAKKVLTAISTGGTDGEKLTRVRQLLEPMSMFAESCGRPAAARFAHRLHRSLAPPALVESLRRNAVDQSFREQVAEILDRSWIDHSAQEKVTSLRKICLAQGVEPLQESLAAVDAKRSYPETNPFRR